SAARRRATGRAYLCAARRLIQCDASNLKGRRQESGAGSQQTKPASGSCLPTPGLMVPEISHRCPGCGVSIHEADVMFCPECGRALAGTDVEQIAAKGEQTGDPGEPAKSPVPPRVTWPSQDDQVKTASDEGKTKKPFTEDRHRARERTREKLQRASQMT